MKQIIRKLQTSNVIALVVFSAILFSFTPEPGGDSFKIYVNDKLVIQERIAKQTAALLPLEADGVNDQVKVYFSHCGKVGSDRSLSVRNANNKVLKEWHYPNVDDYAQGAMTCSARDIVALAGKNKNDATLYYSSSEIPGGIALASIQVTKGKTTALN